MIDIRTILSFVIRSTASKMFGKIILTKPLVIAKRLRSLSDDRTDANFMAPLRISKTSTLDSLKRVLEKEY